MEPLTTQASLPPTIALSARPKRIICKPSPIDWLAEAQALPTAKVGPRQEYRIPSVVAAVLGIMRGTVKGSGRVDCT